MEYLALKEFAELYNISQRTARRTYKKIESQEGAKYQGKDILKYEPLPTGKKKVYILRAWGDEQTKSTGQPTRQPTGQPTGQGDQLNSEMVDILKDQLKAKDIQIETQADQIKDMHIEFQNFQKLEEKIIERYTEMQRSLEMKNEEIKRLQAVAVHRSALLEAYNSKQTKSQDNERIKVNFQAVEEADQVEEVAEPGNINQDNERTFMDWITSTSTTK